ncbi:hypothetical protein BDV93DRAFT_56600 [Ceratobasidium sp. AG-I]|nr:hypothetical protein BDV93DRAFT_56600 [Ceratobasidium sp. AG-I]
MTSPVVHAPNRSRDEMVSAARKKLKTFRAKQGHSPMSSLGNHSVRRSHSRGSSISSLMDSQQPIHAASEATRHAKRRSHSRSASILKLDTDNDSSSMTLPSFTRSPQLESKPANLGGLNRSFSFGGSQPRPTSAAPVMVAMPSSPIRAQQNPARPRPSSHHRRRSSMSTRRESADMMGFDAAALNALRSVDEPIKDDVAKVRERALLALEGKAPRPGKARTVPEIVPSLNLGFSKVEIPDWKTPDVERTFDWTMSGNNKPASFSLGLNSSIAGKRDSFGKNLVPSSSTKAELSVLLEEEEEEEEPTEDKDTAQASVAVYVPGALSAPVASPTKIQPVRSPSPSGRPRPASLNLKALAQASSAAITALPTPSPTPSPTPRSLPGMRPLNLGNGTTYAARRQSMMALGASSPRSSLIASRRQSLRSESQGSGSTHSSRDSLGQGTLVNRLPPTPATGSPTSASSAAAGVEGFLQKNQEVLISRIHQLEKALAKSQRLSGVSDAGSVTPSLAEEQIALVADLKSERNTLVEDVAGYRARVSDLERQAALYAKRVESERRDAFAAREQVKELEVERCAWEADRVTLDETIVRAREDAAAWRGKFEEASKGECHWHARAVNLEADVRRLEKELANARMAQYAMGPTASPSKQRNAPMAPRRFDGSVSSASTTDVEDSSIMSGDMDLFKVRPRAPSPLPNMDVLVEEEEEVYEDSYEEPSLDEDEEESHGVEEDEEDVDSDVLEEVNGDMTISYSMDSFTFPSTRAAELATPVPAERTVPGAFPAPASTSSHARTGSMVRGWQMPRGPVAIKTQSAPKPDCFFDQLEHLYASSEDEPTHERAVPAFEFGSPELGMVKGDGGASAFTFGTRRSVMAGGAVRGHGTRASRASISVGAFDGCGMPPFMNPKPEWIVKTEVAETKAEVAAPKTEPTAAGTGSLGWRLSAPPVSACA